MREYLAAWPGVDANQLDLNSKQGRDMKTVEEAEGKIGLKSIIYQKIPQEFSGEDKLFILRGRREASE